MSNHRIDRQDFTCRNWKFATNTSKGYSHGDHPARGSVLPGEILRLKATGETLWLEHAIGHRSEEGTQGYWLMWYDADGDSKTPASAFFQEAQLGDLVTRLLEATGS